VSGGVIAALLVAVFVWTVVTVVNVRRTTGRRFNPLIAASCWPASAAAIWWIADRRMVDESIGGVVLGFAAQAVALAVPFLVLERSATAVGARRTPLRVVYVLGVVMLIHVQGLGGLLRLPDSVAATEIGRLAAFLAIGALIQLCSTLAVTDACRSLSDSCRHEADHHNMLVGARADERHPTRRRAKVIASS
jgi:quinol-cytochrome oxidoreductase complex cytochrome b subunit